MKILLAIVTAGLAIVCASPAPSKTAADAAHPMLTSKRQVANQDEEENEFWIEKAQNTLSEQVNRQLNRNIAKNVIMFLGDGMSIPTLTATRIYRAQISGGKDTGEGSFLSFEEFPYTGLSRTYCVDKQTADSACSATAYLGGVKANYGTIGLNGRALRGDCDASRDPSNHVDSIAKWANDAGKATGLVTTTRVTHASPAGVYSHTADRDWENDAEAGSGQDGKKCSDIAEQLIFGDVGSKLNVIMGGGRNNFLPNNVSDPSLGKGDRSDGQNLINAWKEAKAQKDAAFVSNRTGLLSLSGEIPDYLLGLFSPDHLDYHLENATEQPTLEEMTEKAIQVLEKSGKGYFLFVEGGKIDLAHHDTKPHISLDEAVELSKAVQRAVDITSEDDTLIVVTSDHAHTMTVSGYADRGTDIFKFAGTADDGRPYNILTYANGPGYRKLDENGMRPDESKEDTDDINYLAPATAPLSGETHGADDVGVFARGPWSHLFVGSFEQNYIPHAMAYALCVGDGLTACQDIQK